jgi:hypothetical protein
VPFHDVSDQGVTHSLKEIQGSFCLHEGLTWSFLPVKIAGVKAHIFDFARYGNIDSPAKRSHAVLGRYSPSLKEVLEKEA